MVFPFFLILLHFFSCCYPLMSSALSLFAPFFLKKRVWSSCFVWQKVLLLHPLCKRDKVFSWNVDKAPVGFDLCGFTFKKNFSESLEVKLKSLYLCSPVRKKGSSFCWYLRSCQKSFRRRKRKKTLKKKLPKTFGCYFETPYLCTRFRKRSKNKRSVLW